MASARGRAARARVRGAARVDDRRHPGRWPASSAAPASRPACRWRPIPGSSARRRSPRPIASWATRATPRPRERLYDLAQDPHGIYDCTHCFSCVDACPKDVAPMDQIMRLRRLASHDHEIDDVNNGRRHETAFTKIIEKKGTLDESLLLQESYAQGVKGKLIPRAERDQGPRRLDPDRDPGAEDGQDALAAEADPRRPPQAPRRRPGPREAALLARRGAPHRAQPLHRRRGGDRARRGGPTPRRRSSPSPTRWASDDGRCGSPTGPAASPAASPPSCTARWRWSPSGSGSSW